jgi:hypothetical protein
MNEIIRTRYFESDSDNPKSKIQNLKLVGLSVIAIVLAVAGAVAEAQQPTKIPRIGYLTVISSSASAQFI